MELQFPSLLCFVALVVAVTGVFNLPSELESENTDVNGIKQRYPSRRNDQLYYEIATKDFDRAVTIAQEFIDNRESHVIKTVVDQLIGQHRTYVGGFAYKLFAAGHRKIVEDHFPTPYRMVFNDSLIKFTNNRFNLPIDLSQYTDSAGDYTVFAKLGTSNTNNFVWKLVPVVDANGVYFKIYNTMKNVYLKLNTDMDLDGDHQAFASPTADTERHQWMFQPVEYEGKVCFCIVNRAHNQALKLAASTSGKYRILYSTYTDFFNYPERYGWRVDIITGS